MEATQCTNSATISAGRPPLSGFASRRLEQRRRRRRRRRQQGADSTMSDAAAAAAAEPNKAMPSDHIHQHDELLLRLQPAARSHLLTSLASAASDARRRTRQQARAPTRLKSQTSTLKQSSLAAGLVALVVFTLMLKLVTSNMAAVEGAKLPDIYWNASNPIFRRENLDHIFEVNKKQHDHDQVDLVCPQAQPQQVSPEGSPSNQTNELQQGQQQQQQSTPERYIIYNVSKDEYDNCRLNGPSAQMVAKCDQPQSPSSRPPRPTTITFRSFTPQPNGLEFKPGQDYYFITALSGHHQEPQRRFSPCRELNMRVIFRVCCKAPQLAGAPTTSSPASTGPGGPLASLISAVSPNGSHSNGAQKPAAPARAPLVSTVRPTFKPVPQSDLFATQPDHNQPVTVLPIEVIQPGESSPTSDQVQQSPPAQPNANTPSQDQNNNVFDVIMNEQPNKQLPSTSEIFGVPQAPPPPPSLAHQHQAHRSQPPPQFLPFDPTAAPDLMPDVLRRWSPTPLPPRIRTPWPPRSPPHPPENHSKPSLMLMQQQQQQQPQLPVKPWPESQAGSRLHLYPWSPVQDTNVQPAPQLITVPPDHNNGQQGLNSTGAPTYAVALLVPLLGLAILLALGLERRLR